jgi:hypothetical protein
MGEQSKKAAERKPLRDSLGVADDSPLREVAMRNNFEHIDERIERWWEGSPLHHYIDLNVSDSPLSAGSSPQDTFRNFNPQTAKLTFWSEDFDVQAIVNEVQLLLPKLEAATGISRLGAGAQ